MEIGEKIKAVRMAKRMTQSDLAGDQITRNMLSLIENGSALPSIPTIMYISERLDVPIGMLLAGAEEELVYTKMNKLPKIKQAFSRREYKLCADMCINLIEENADNCDDELAYILAESYFNIAVEEFNHGKLHNACKEFDRSCDYCKKTIYNCKHILCSVSVYFEYMMKLSPTLTSDSDNEIYSGSEYFVDSFGKYLKAIDALDKNDSIIADEYLLGVSEEECGFADHIRARIEMKNGNFKGAREILEHLLYGNDLFCRAITHNLFADLELCCRETGDYKGAYEYSVGKMELLEYMLKD